MPGSHIDLTQNENDDPSDLKLSNLEEILSDGNNPPSQLKGLAKQLYIDYLDHYENIFRTCTKKRKINNLIINMGLG